MTIDQAIQLGQISVNNFQWWHFWIGIVLIVVSSLCILVYTGSEGLTSFILWSCLILFIGFSLYYEAKDMLEEEELIAKWRNEVAYPYIESLPTEKHEIVYIKIDPELSHNVSGGLFHTYSVPVKLTPLTVSFKGQGVETVTDWYETYMELTDEKKPYIEFKKLEHNLGNGVNAGLYNKKVYLPESYEFTDIK